MTATSDVEPIPGTDNVSRWLFSPPLSPDLSELAQQQYYHMVFAFPSSNNRCESVVWSKYAPTPLDVHNLGCEDQSRRRIEHPHKNAEYLGSLTANVAKIRDFKNINGHGFDVVHAPEEGQHHAHIFIAPNPDKTLNRGDLNNLRERLRTEVFIEHSSHTCP